MDARDRQSSTANDPGDGLVSPHGAAKQAESTDPLGLVGTKVAGGDIDYSARCLIEEYAAMGYGSEQILELFRQPQYVAMHATYRAKGEGAVRELIREVLADCGVFRVSGSIAGPPSPRVSELMQINLPPLSNDQEER